MRLCAPCNLAESGLDVEGDELHRLCHENDDHFERGFNHWADPHQQLKQAQFFKVLGASSKQVAAEIGQLSLIRGWPDFFAPQV